MHFVQVHELVGRINGSRGSLSRVPLQSLDRSVGCVDLCALYLVADCLFITSLRDGMNLVALEFVACQQAKMNVAKENEEQQKILQSLPGRGLSLDLRDTSSLLMQQDVIEKLIGTDGSCKDVTTQVSDRPCLLQRRPTEEKEIIDRGPGVLILSEFAGAAEFLEDGSLIINPWNEQQSAEALFTALTMSREERESRHR